MNCAERCHEIGWGKTFKRHFVGILRSGLDKPMTATLLVDLAESHLLYTLKMPSIHSTTEIEFKLTLLTTHNEARNRQMITAMKP